MVWASAGFFMQGQDEVIQPVPLVVVLGGGLAGARLQVACELFLLGNGRDGVVVTGGNHERFVPDKTLFLNNCGIPLASMIHWPDTANSYDEMLRVSAVLLSDGNSKAIVVSDSLHMPRLRYLREIFELQHRVYFRQSILEAKLNADYFFPILVFWFREPLAYMYYRFKY
jgi:uncharacterized SAM-binding protein YcdF (DUF218 family)